MPRISVVIPVYNVELYISRCLDSIINQTFSDIEIFCVNDGSTDGSLAIIKEYAKKDSRIIIIDQENKGVSIARNIALDRATGEYISFVDSDDELIPEAYERLLSIAQKDYDAIMFGAKIVSENGSPPPQEDINYLDIPQEGHCLIDDVQLVRLSVYPWNKLYRREAIERVKLRFPDRCIFEDACFFYCFFSVYRSVYFMKDKFYIYYRRSGSLMQLTHSKKENYGIFHIFIFDWIYDFWNKNHVFEGREDVFCERFVVYIKHAFDHSPNYEHARCAWEATRRLRKWNIDTSKFPVLSLLQNGGYDLCIMQSLLFYNHNVIDKKISGILLSIIYICLKIIYCIVKFFKILPKRNRSKTVLDLLSRLKCRIEAVKTIKKYNTR